MAEGKRMAEEVNRMSREAQEGTRRMGKEFQNVSENGFEAASRSFSEVNRGFQAMAAEITDFSKRRWEEVFHAWQQLLQARHFGDVVDAQTQYAQKAYDAYISELSKVGEIYLGTVREAARPLQQASNRSD